jgi:hypothetical protein
MATAVEIASNAMLRLGGQPINSFDEADATGANIERVRLAANLWPSVRRMILRSHTWNSAIKRVLLSPDAAAPAFGYTNRYQRPSDWLRTLQVGEDPNSGIDYVTEGNYFLTDEDSFPLVYVFDNDNPATYDAALSSCMESAMSWAMCYAVTKSTSLRETLAGELSNQLATARAIDGQDDPPQALGGAGLYASRFGYQPGVR